MVSVGVADHHGRHLARPDPRGGKALRHLPEGGAEEVSRAGIDEHEFPADLEEQGVHVQVEPVRREEGGPQHPVQLLLRCLGRPGRLDRLEAQAPVADHDRLDLPDRKPVVSARLRAFQRGRGGGCLQGAAPGERRHHPGGPRDLQGVPPGKRRLAEPFVLQHGLRLLSCHRSVPGEDAESFFLRWRVPDSGCLRREDSRGDVDMHPALPDSFPGQQGFGISFPVDAIASERGFAAMPIELKLPDVGEGIAEGEIVRWLVAEGAAGQGGRPAGRDPDRQGEHRAPLAGERDLREDPRAARTDRESGGAARPHRARGGAGHAQHLTASPEPPTPIPREATEPGPGSPSGKAGRRGSRHPGRPESWRRTSGWSWARYLEAVPAVGSPRRTCGERRGRRRRRAPPRSPRRRSGSPSRGNAG